MTPAKGDALDAQTTLIEPLGRGGMGNVWLASYEPLKAEVVAKHIAPELAKNDMMRERLLREARAAARVRSAHVVKTYDVRMSDAFGPFLVLERLDGESLDARLSRLGRLPVAEAQLVVAQVAHALDDAHGQGIIHRDIKPSNIFLVPTPSAPFLVKLLDFGIARVAGEETTQGEVRVGTFGYMSPEQIDGLPLDGRSDLHSLALVFFKLVTGEAAVPRETLAIMGSAALRLPLRSPREVVPSLPPAIDDWFAKAAAASPSARFATGAEMSRALDVALGLRSVALADTVLADTEPANPQLRTAKEPTAETKPIVESTLVQPAESKEEAPPTAKPKPRSTWPFALAAVVVGGGAFAWWWGRGEPPVRTATSASASTAAPIGSASAPIRVAALVDQTSENRERGKAIRSALEAAAGLFAEHGGVRGRPFEIVAVNDDGAKDGSMRGAFDRARSTSTVPIVLGPILSSQALVVGPWLAEAPTLAVSPSATLPRSTDLSRWLVRSAPSDADAGRALAELVGRTPACSLIALVVASGPYELAFEQALLPALATAHVTPATTLHVEPRPEKSYGAAVDQVRASGARCLVLVVPPAVGARYLLDARDRHLAVKTFATDSLASADFVALARGDRKDATAPSAAEGVMGIRFRQGSLGNREYGFFTRTVTADGGVVGDTFAATAFDAAILTGLALEKVGPDGTAEAYRQALVAISRQGAAYGPQDLDELLLAIRAGRDVDYQGASGAVDLTDEGDVHADFVGWRVEAGAFVDVVLP